MMPLRDSILALSQQDPFAPKLILIHELLKPRPVRLRGVRGAQVAVKYHALRPALKPFHKQLKGVEDEPGVGMPRYFPGDYLPVVQVLDAVEAERPLKAGEIGDVLHYRAAPPAVKRASI